MTMTSSYAKRVDANHNEIVACFEQCQCLVWDSSRMGGGFPDLIVQRRHPVTGNFETYLVEVKDNLLPPYRRKLNTLQRAFHKLWHCHVVECPDDVFKLLEINVF